MGEKSSTPELYEAAKKHNIRRALAPRRVSERRVHLDVICAEDGRLIEDPDAVGEVLKNEWA